MKAEIRTFVIDICFWIVTISIMFFFFTLWLFSYNNIDNPLKESWSLTVSMLSALATIGAAIIASKLYQNWKAQHSYTEQIKILSLMLDCVNDIQVMIWQARSNNNLVKIIIGHPYERDLEISFAEQTEKLTNLTLKINSLYKFESQISLLINEKVKQPIFNYEDLEQDCPIEELKKIIGEVIVAITLFNTFLTHTQDELIQELHKQSGLNSTEMVLSHESINFSSPYLTDLILKIMATGDICLGIAYPQLKFEENSYNQKIESQINSLKTSIMEYRENLNFLD
ncbi:hypothetical protein NNO96_13940 [Acinetobacter baumannii]|uniref:hypothetical protein n=1 Tax=Acinetobacter baumannii TaxID=470 RepID=UPI0020CF905B|nr:hypothetical protein [Acinetobacter baumannii]MCQ1073305.1 hypothetical protein [Acinetobacter baumannii]